MSRFVLTASHLKKVFSRRVIFENISFVVQDHQTLLITGRNGSGKSTLVKMLSDVLSPTQGSVQLTREGIDVKNERWHWIGLVSPYLQMYDEFTAKENLRFFLSIRGMKPDEDALDAMLERVFLHSRRNDQVRTYSSGMKQRMKYAFALVHRPPILVLDEPMANLDTEGIRMVREIMEQQRQQGILIVATNDLSDVDTFDIQVDLHAG